MANKITPELAGTMNQIVHKTETIKILIGEETYEVKIAGYLTVEIKEKMLNELIKLIQFFKYEDPSENIILVTIAVLKSLTDIEFPNDPEQDMQYLINLTDMGIVEKVMNSIPEKLTNEIAQTITTMAKILPTMYPKEWEKANGEKSRI